MNLKQLLEVLGDEIFVSVTINHNGVPMFLKSDPYTLLHLLNADALYSAVQKVETCEHNNTLLIESEVTD